MPYHTPLYRSMLRQYSTGVLLQDRYFLLLLNPADGESTDHSILTSDTTRQYQFSYR